MIGAVFKGSLKLCINRLCIDMLLVYSEEFCSYSVNTVLLLLLARFRKLITRNIVRKDRLSEGNTNPALEFDLEVNGHVFGLCFSETARTYPETAQPNSIELQHQLQPNPSSTTPTHG